MKTNDVIKKYVSDEQDRYKMLALKVHEVLFSILGSKSIVPQSITYRAKDPKSLREKITRTGKDYDNPLSEIMDLAGVRIITYFPSDVDKIVELIEKEFKIDRRNLIDKRITSDPSVFGYASVHLVAEFAPERLKLPEYGIFKDMKCEIQVRTILQHAWAEIEHDIVYKSTEDIPFELRRRFSSLSGLLELADREFELLRQDEMKVRKRIKTTINKDEIDIPINLDSVRFYLEKYHKQKEFAPEKIRNLIRLIKLTDIETIRDLNNILTPEALSIADKDIKKIVVRCPEKITLKCLLRYFLAIGTHLDMPIEKIGDLVRCPEFNTKRYKNIRGQILS